MIGNLKDHEAISLLRWFIPIVLFKSYTRKHSLTLHMYKFSMLLILGLLTIHHQTIFIIKSCPVNTYPHIYDWDLTTL